MTVDEQQVIADEVTRIVGAALRDVVAAAGQILADNNLECDHFALAAGAIIAAHVLHHDGITVDDEIHEAQMYAQNVVDRVRAVRQ